MIHELGCPKEADPRNETCGCQVQHPSTPQRCIGFLRAFHRSVLQPIKVWTVEEREGYGWHRPWVVRCYEGDVMVSQEKFMFERAARQRFERKVEEHYKNA